VVDGSDWRARGQLDGDGGTDDSADAVTETIGAVDRPERRRRRWPLVIGYTVVGLVSLLVLSTTGFAWAEYTTIDNGVHKSDVLGAGSGEKKSLDGDTNILIMGLDSRLDENGNPLPQDIYDALHAGDDSVGGYNANVLMLLHVPAHGKATEISIPRDDYVDLPGAPDGIHKEKIKQAYGLAFDQENKKLRAQGVTDKTTLEQQSRDAGRREEIDTVSQFLGGVPIDHFIEVTLVAFYQIAQVVQPITVCVLKATKDTFSGADFPAGQLQLSAGQAVAFVRQRRDNVKGDFYYNNFTDLDRERRQQAFIASLAVKLKQAGTFTNPSTMSQILAVAKQNIAIDDDLDLLTFAQEASNLTGGNVSFNTLPVQSYADLKGAGDVNIVNVPLIQSEVRTLLGTPATPSGSAAPTTTSSAPPPPGTVDVENASGQGGIAGTVLHALAGRGFTAGASTTATERVSTSHVYYGTGGTAAAQAVATALGGLPVAADHEVAAGHVKVVLGKSFSLPSSLAGSGSGSTISAPPTVTPPPSSPNAPEGSDANPMSALQGGQVPCVK
jgi:LCP family protein required for cell wall assembly